MTLCLAQILLGLKGYFRASRLLKSCRHHTLKYCGPGVYGATVALIGAGAISAKIQELLHSFHVNVIVVPSRKERRTVSLEEAFAAAQVVSNHLPDRDDNAGVLNGALFRSMREKGLQYNQPIHIGRNCWIGAGAILLPGVSVGDNSVIGAGSVVTKDIPANVVAAGVPCRVLHPIQPE